MGIVAEFAHLHPWNGAAPLLHPEGISLDRQIIYVDLTIPPGELWETSFNHACRKNIRRAQRENIRVFPAGSEADIHEFHRIYINTMQRNQAAPQYYFSLDYFMDFFKLLGRHATFMLAECQGKIVAGTLYLHDDRDIYSYLGGADQAFQQMRPTNAVVYETILWGQQLGKRRLILGGGYRPDDGIFRFKSSFSPQRADFYIYKFVHSHTAYESICRRWAVHYGGQPGGRFFPLYRAVPEVAVPAAQ
jgi:lipid II:glycine glycyltransferase (peptidoglycan interpeptide bridge formation enzyme)